MSECMTGIGPDGSIPFPVVSIYFYNEENNVYYSDENIDSAVSYKLGTDKKFKNIDDIKKIIKDLKIKK
jgi:hypothetical protein